MCFDNIKPNLAHSLLYLYDSRSQECVRVLIFKGLEVEKEGGEGRGGGSLCYRDLMCPTKPKIFSI